MLPEVQITFFAAAALWFPLTPSAVNGSSN